MSRATYSVTFRAVDGQTMADARFLDESSADGYELIEVTDACASWHCEADLWLANGERAGWVHADGSYRLVKPANPSPDADYTPVSVGFDLRRTGHTVQLPPGAWIVVRYCEGTDEHETGGPPAKVADVLRAAGYTVREPDERRPLTITTVRDLETWIRDVRADVVEHGLLAALAEAIRTAPGRPAWGADWRAWLDEHTDALVQRMAAVREPAQDGGAS